VNESHVEVLYDLLGIWFHDLINRSGVGVNQGVAWRVMAALDLKILKAICGRIVQGEIGLHNVAETFLPPFKI
jgi:hypothetical protein